MLLEEGAGDLGMEEVWPEEAGEEEEEEEEEGKKMDVLGALAVTARTRE